MLPVTPFAAPPDRDSRLARLHPASKLAGLVLALVSCFAVPWWGLPGVLLLLLAGLLRRGSGAGDLLRGLRPWWPVALLVLAVHVLTTTSAAPLWHPSWTGLGRGVTALARVGGSVAALALYLRIAPLDAMAAGLAWWRRPGRRGADAGRPALVLAVALGAVPGVLAEGRRIEAVTRLRRGGAARGRGPRRWWRRAADRAHLAVPLLEGLFRRAEGLSLALLDRRPRTAETWRPLPAGELLGLAAWAAGLLLLAFL